MLSLCWAFSSKANHPNSQLLSLCPCMYSLTPLCALCSSISMTPLVLERSGHRTLDVAGMTRPKDHLSRVAGNVLPDAAFFATRVYYSCLMVLGPQHLFCKAASHPLFCTGAWSCSPLDPAHVFAELHELLLGPFLQPVTMPSNTSTDIWLSTSPHTFPLPSDFLRLYSVPLSRSVSILSVTGLQPDLIKSLSQRAEASSSASFQSISLSTCLINCFTSLSAPGHFVDIRISRKIRFY